MAYSTRAYYEQTNNQDVLDRIEIQEDGFSGSAIQLQANDQGFKWRLSEITSESDKGLINPLANKIQVGKLTFFPRIETSAEQTLLDDILGSPDSQFRIVWKQDGSVFWTGNIDNKRRSHPETGGSYFATIRANDFEILQNTDYTSDGTPSGSLLNSRQTLIETISDLLGYLDFGLKIRTATSWITQNTTDATDFLSQINHETKALRKFGRTGDESDEPISVWDALEKIGGPALLFRQVNGEFTVEQLTEFDDPENVNETVYTSAGVVDTATTTVDRTLDADKATSEGSLVVKDGSPNDRYPAIKRATVTFDHRTKVSGIQFEESFDLDSSTTTKSYSQFFLSDGNQEIEIEGLVEAYFPSGHDDVTADIRIKIIRSGDDYFWNGDDWVTTAATISKDLIDSGRSTPQGQLHFIGFREFTDPTPSDADGTLEITFLRADSAASGFADTTTYRNAVFDIKNAVANENSTSINYQLTQSNGYTTDFELKDTWFGDGPTGYALSALRSGSSDADFIVDGWQRRGTTTGYRSFHEQLLKEIIDLQRTNTRKLNANFWGTYDPSKILVYDSQNFYCAGVSYVGHRGRWSANLFRVNVQTGSDTFEDIPKFSDDTGTGTGSSGGSSGGGGGSFDASLYDNRWFNINDNLSEGDPASMRGSLNFESTVKDIVAGSGGTFQTVGHGQNTVFGNINMDRAQPQEAGDEISLTYTNNDQERARISFRAEGEFATGIRFYSYDGSDPVLGGRFDDDGNFILHEDFRVQNLTDGRVLLAGASGLVEDDSALTFDGTSLEAPTMDMDTLVVNDVDIFPSGGEQALGEPDSPTWDGATFTGQIDVLMGGASETRNISNAGFHIARGTFPSFVLDETSGSTDGKIWQVYADDYIAFRRLNDDSGSKDNAIEIYDTGEITLFDTLTGVDAVFSDEVEVNGIIDANDDIKLDDANTNISSDTFQSGFAGSGLAFLQDGTWDGTLDNLTVRQRLRVYELLINQVRATNGSLVVTSATKTGREDDLGFSPVEQLGGTLDWNSSDTFWTESDQYWYRTYRVYIEENQFVPFVEDDLVISQRFTGGGTHLVEGTVINVENGSSTVTDNSTRRYFDINITADSDVPASGMDFVRWGNLSDPDRQGVLYLTADDDDAPYMDIVYGMDAHSKRNASGTVKGRIGRLDGIIDPDFPTLDGTQTNLFGLYIDGGYFNNVEVRGTITVLDEDASNAATKDYVDNATSAAGNQIIRSDSEPSTRTDGSPLVEGDMWEDTDAVLSDTRSTWMWDGSDWVEPFTVINGARLATESVTAAKILAGTITTNEINFTPLTSTDGTGDIIATINATSEGINIEGDNIHLNGDTSVAGSFSVVGENITLDGDTTITGAFELNGDALINGTVTADEIDLTDLFAQTITVNTGGSIQSGNYSAGSDGFIINASGDVEFNDGTFRGSLDDLTVDGTLTMGTSGEITNSTGDYTIDEDGILFAQSDSFGSGIAIQWEAASGDPMAIFGTSATGGGNLIYQSEVHEFENKTGTTLIRLIEDAGQGIQLDLINLPTSAPSGSNHVWNDGGTLKIT